MAILNRDGVPKEEVIGNSPLTLPSLSLLLKQDDLPGNGIDHAQLTAGEVFDFRQGAESAELHLKRLALLDQADLHYPEILYLIAKTHDLDMLPHVEEQTEQQNPAGHEYGFKFRFEPPLPTPSPDAEGEFRLQPC
jgi:hypothetical protein